MNFLKVYRDYLLTKKPQAAGVQYFWLAMAVGMMGYAVWNAASASLARTAAIVVICLSIAVDAATNLSYFRNKSLFEKLVNVKIGANIVSLVAIVVFVVIWYKFKM